MKGIDSTLTLPAASVNLAVNEVVDPAVTVTTTDASPPAGMVTVVTGNPVPVALLNIRSVLPASPITFKVGVSEEPGLAGDEDVMFGVVGATLSCV